MSILYLFAAIIAVLGFFIGLVVIIKGFVNKNDKNINLGTILVSIGLIIALSGVFCLGQRAVKVARCQLNQRHMMMQQCIKDCDVEIMKCCELDDSTALDSNCMKKCTKELIEKGCMKKPCSGPCKGHKD